MSKRKIQVITIAVLIGIMAILGALFYITTYLPADENAIALQDTLMAEGRLVEHDIFWSWEPTDSPVEPDLPVLVFIPGGKVDEIAYLPLLAPLSDAGYHILIEKAPFHLAIFAPGRVAKVIDAGAGSDTPVVLMGHSLGGTVASMQVSSDPANIAGLIFLASYAAGDISGSGVPVLTIYGTQDGLISKEEIDEKAALAGENHQIFSIIGGNHAQFGSYGLQGGDGAAAISREGQQARTVELILRFISEL